MATNQLPTQNGIRKYDGHAFEDKIINLNSKALLLR